MPHQPNSRRITETVLILFLLLGLLYAMYAVLMPFFGVFTFAIIFAVSFSKLFERLVKLLKFRRKLAAIIYSVVLIAIVAIPFIYIIASLRHRVHELSQWIVDAKTTGVPPLPAWITDLPYAGNDIATFWSQLQDNPKSALLVYEPQLKLILHHILTSGAGMAGVALEFIAGIVVSAFFLLSGRKIMVPVYATTNHLFGEKDGRNLILATAQAVRGVAIGVMGTAFIAAIVSWIGFMIAGIPFALGLAALVYFLVLIQVGPLVVWVPLVIYMVAQGQTGWAIFIGIYGLLVLGLDSILKPILIAKSGKLPFLVLFLGVIGGLVAWGFTGMFKGAIVMAVFYTVFKAWMESRKTDIIIPEAEA